MKGGAHLLRHEGDGDRIVKASNVAKHVDGGRRGALWPLRSIAAVSTRRATHFPKGTTMAVSQKTCWASSNRDRWQRLVRIQVLRRMRVVVMARLSPLPPKKHLLRLVELYINKAFGLEVESVNSALVY